MAWQSLLCAKSFLAATQGQDGPFVQTVGPGVSLLASVSPLVLHIWNAVSASVNCGVDAGAVLHAACVNAAIRGTCCEKCLAAIAHEQAVAPLHGHNRTSDSNE
jgi:hypothetical protein